MDLPDTVLFLMPLTHKAAACSSSLNHSSFWQASCRLPTTSQGSANPKPWGVGGRELRGSREGKARGGPQTFLLPMSLVLLDRSKAVLSNGMHCVTYMLRCSLPSQPHDSCAALLTHALGCQSSQTRSKSASTRRQAARHVSSCPGSQLATSYAPCRNISQCSASARHVATERLHAQSSRQHQQALPCLQGVGDVRAKDCAAHHHAGNPLEWSLHEGSDLQCIKAAGQWL